METQPHDRVSVYTGFWRPLRQPPVVVTAALLMAILAWDAYGYLTASSRLTPAARHALDAGARTLDVTVTVGFTLEAFHMRYFQEQGQVINVTSYSVTLRDVPASSVWAMARQYWISSIVLARGNARQ